MITCEDYCNIVNISLDIKDTQNYITASDLVISKAGWGTIGEALIGHTPMALIERTSTKEDSFNIEKLKENNLCISISEKDMTTIDYRRD